LQAEHKANELQHLRHPVLHEAFAWSIEQLPKELENPVRVTNSQEKTNQNERRRQQLHT
jgi:hypothetical protein